jgi:dCTP deaminase
MIVSGRQIKKAHRAGKIVIDPWDDSRLNPNSYNLRLSKHMVEYDEVVLDMAKDNRFRRFEIPPEGLVLAPNKLYLGQTMEYTETHDHVPMIEGRSSIGRLGVCIHVTAGFGDKNFCGQWTLELFCVQPVRIYAGVEVAQIYYHEIDPEAEPYDGKYQDYSRASEGPMPSKLWREFG